MQTRRDQVQAHRFVVGRLTTGLMRTDPDAPEGPHSRTNRAMAFGGALGAVLAVGFLVFGLISPGGSDAWRDPRTLIVEAGTGNRYLYDGTLRPVRNYASARLIVGERLASRTVPSASLAGTARGGAVGIDGAPDALPPAGRVDGGPWQVCAGTAATASGGTVPTTTLTVDGDRGAAGLGSGQGLLVRGPDDREYLLWHGNRFRLAAGTATADALGYGTARPLPVSAAFLDAVPASADLAPPAVPGRGSAGPRLDGRPTKVGQVFVVDTPGAVKQYYLLQRAGLVPVSTTQAALVLASPEERVSAYGGGAPVAVPIAADALGGALVRGAPAGVSDVLPQAPPVLVPLDGGRAACVRVDGAVSAPGAGGAGRARRVRVGLGVLSAPAASGVRGGGPQAPAAPACRPVDAVLVPPSGGSLVRALDAAGSPVGSTTYLVTDAGVKYLLADAKAAGALGYDVTRARGLPSPLLSMVPTGPDLSQRDALSGRAVTTTLAGCAGTAGTSGKVPAGQAAYSSGTPSVRVPVSNAQNPRHGTPLEKHT
ncbi:type VII secretion protein EccB [Streptomyces sp. J2-1]|uniref:type VII secretion protein EccB n=1 Tax=Streptomyces corallincola TaxID=2851888 RepID=UPI001C393C8E|nr:type VII secretion protein EccB [Streptomyces corallincola]MBV2354904.1 type VII secretion protein EccB [Streptomyces corallincola]